LACWAGAWAAVWVLDGLDYGLLLGCHGQVSSRGFFSSFFFFFIYIFCFCVSFQF
jgi:hypothetical protein